MHVLFKFNHIVVIVSDPKESLWLTLLYEKISIEKNRLMFFLSATTEIST